VERRRHAASTIPPCRIRCLIDETLAGPASGDETVPERIRGMLVGAVAPGGDRAGAAAEKGVR